MPRGFASLLRSPRYYRADDLHCITGSCHRRLPELRTARSRDRFLKILEQVRQRYQFVALGYVVMPEHVHLLMSGPEVEPGEAEVGGGARRLAVE